METEDSNLDFTRQLPIIELDDIEASSCLYWEFFVADILVIYSKFNIYVKIQDKYTFNVLSALQVI